MNRHYISIKKLVFSMVICILVLGVSSVTPKAGDMDQNVKSKTVGYYTSWSSYSGFTPDKIDPNKLTHINYAFANIDKELKVVLGDTEIDSQNIAGLKKLKEKNPNLKLLISVGGWTWSDKFSDAALTHASRTRFANSCVEFIKTYGFDGVDLDWEYPVSGGLKTNKYRKEDKENFTLLLKTIRERFNEESKKDGKEYILSIAGGAGAGYIQNVELDKLHKYIDFANIMTYDIHGPWDKHADFVAPLYTDESSNNMKASVDSGIKAWIKAGFPKEKLVVGIPFYGYEYHISQRTNNGLYQKHTKAFSISYNDINSKYLNKNGYRRYYSSKSMVPWLYNGTSFISYEDGQSIGEKAKYIKSNKLGGAMIWELGQDLNGQLLDKLYKGLK